MYYTSWCYSELSILLIMLFTSVLVFGNTFFVSVLSFISVVMVVMSELFLSSTTLGALILSLMYLSGIMVLFSYSFMLSDLKSKFVGGVGLWGLVYGFFVFMSLPWFDLGVVGNLSSQLTELYWSNSLFVLVFSGMLLASVLVVCLLICTSSVL